MTRPYASSALNISQERADLRSAGRSIVRPYCRVPQFHDAPLEQQVAQRDALGRAAPYAALRPPFGGQVGLRQPDLRGGEGRAYATGAFKI